MLASKILSIGAKHAVNEFEKRNLIITNFAFAIGLITSGVLSSYLLFTNNVASGLLISCGFSLCLLGFILNNYGKFSLALIAACGVTGIVIPIHNWFYPNTGVFAYLLTACVIVSFLSAQKSRLRQFLIAYSFGALLVTLGTIIFVHDGIQVTDSSKIPIIMNAFGSLTSLIWAVSYFSQQLQLQQIKYENLNQVKNRLLAVLAHDIRGPLNNLVGISELINRGEIEQQDSEEMMNSLTKEIKGAANLLDDVLIWIRSQMDGLETNKVLFDLKATCLKVIEENLSKAEMKGVKIDFKGEATRTFSDKDMIALALRNLLSNAIKFSPKDFGHIVIEIKQELKKPKITIKDNGKGLSDSEIEKIKELKSFSNTGSDSEKGFGIGLFLTNEFLRQNDAFLDVKNNELGGAEFSINFSAN